MFKEGPECGKPMKGLSVGDRSGPLPPSPRFTSPPEVTESVEFYDRTLDLPSRKQLACCLVEAALQFHIDWLRLRFFRRPRYRTGF